MNNNEKECRCIFNRGDIIEVMDGNTSWHNRIFVEYINGSEKPFVCVGEHDDFAPSYDRKFHNNEKFKTTNWQHGKIKVKQKVVEVTMEDIENKYNCEVKIIR